MRAVKIARGAGPENELLTSVTGYLHFYTLFCHPVRVGRLCYGLGGQGREAQAVEDSLRALPGA
jgi:hypothetical protein